MDGFDGSGEHLFLLNHWQEQMDPLLLYFMASTLCSERAGVVTDCLRACLPNASDGPRTTDDVVDKLILTSVIDVYINS